MSDLVCPVCKSGDHLWTIDTLDYGVYALRCAQCLWEGTNEELIDKEKLYKH